MKLVKGVALVTEAEEGLAERLSKLAARHPAEHDVYQMARTLAERSRDHLTGLAPLADELGAPHPRTDAGESVSLTEAVGRVTAAIVGRTEVTGMTLLLDLRDAYLVAQYTEVTWVILLQAARAARHAQLTTLATSYREEAEGTAKWLRTRIKESAPQVLATS